MAAAWLCVDVSHRGICFAHAGSAHRVRAQLNHLELWRAVIENCEHDWLLSAKAVGILV